MFKFVKNDTISDIILIEPQVFGDDRGFFMETYNKKEFETYGINCDFLLDGHSKSQKGVFRGFHFQVQHIQAKIVRAVHGSVLDFAIDLRKNSPTYGKCIFELLSAENKKQLFIPRGFAHGFLSLQDGTELLYRLDNTYDQQAERGIIYSDSDLDIDWQNIMKQYDIKEFIMSEKDKKHLTLQEFYTSNPF